MTDQLEASERGGQRGLLWHHTTFGGFKGIATSKVLWATDAGCLNDSREILQAPEIVQGALSRAHKLLHEGGNGTSVRPFWRALRLFYYAPNADDITVRVAEAPFPFVTSFCAKEDLLTQWTGYGATQAGDPGYALGFRREDLENAAAAVHGRLLPVIYPDPENDDCPDSASNPDEHGVVTLDMFECAQIKHPSFRSEHEYRIVVDGNTSLTRQHRIGLYNRETPYVEIPLERICPAVVMIGPQTLAGDGAVEAVQEVLHENQWAAAEVRQSRIPLRTPIAHDRFGQ